MQRRIMFLAFFAALLAMLTSAAFARGQAAATAAPPTQTGALAATPTTERFDPVAATNAYLAKVPPDKKAKSDAYFEGGYWLILWDSLASSFVLTPITNTYPRVQEYEADVFGLNAARQPDGEAEVDLKLADYRKLDPGPIEEFLFYDHPSGGTRTYAAMRGKAEHLHELDNALPQAKP